ncbi:MAG TPA: PKD domain-containing protein, partial [Clostridiaceae bacterium]|nr:PKD domain-containing protein [Clostridiaceae bacterium]
MRGLVHQEGKKSGGGTSVSPKDINFYDYDGTIVASWTLVELTSATELPASPTHDGLTAQGWNWTLADLKTENAPMNVGQMYITSDEKTHLTITIAEFGRMVVPLYFSQTVANGVTIDWGDGSQTQTLTGTGNRNTTHTYATPGTYDITLDVAEGCEMKLGNGSSSYCVLGATNNAGRVYCNMLQSVRIGSRAGISAYAFYNCYSLASITIPSSV